MRSVIFKHPQSQFTELIHGLLLIRLSHGTILKESMNIPRSYKWFRSSNRYPQNVLVRHESNGTSRRHVAGGFEMRAISRYQCCYIEVRSIAFVNNLTQGVAKTTRCDYKTILLRIKLCTDAMQQH